MTGNCNPPISAGGFVIVCYRYVILAFAFTKD